MSDVLTINGGYNAVSGVVSVASNFSAASDINTILNSYLASIGGALTDGRLGLDDDEVVGTSPSSITAAGSGAGQLFEITNMVGPNSVIGGTVSGSYAVDGTATYLVVEAPGDETVQGNDATQVAIFGATSNVDYNSTASGGSASIYAAGGDDSVNDTGANENLAVYSAGNDTVQFNGTGGNDSVYASGNASTTVFVGGSDMATVIASGNATVSVVFLQNAGGDLDFINNSSAAQTVFSGNYTVPGGGTVYANNAVTAFGGAGGGYYVGGRGGENSLVGGTGLVTLQGGGPSDFLEANAYTTVAGQENVLFAAGGGNETLLGSASTGNNLFQIGLGVTGEGNLTPSADIISTAGSGQQSFIIGNTDASTLTGSNAAGAYNTFNVVGDSTAGGGSFTIADFNSVNSAMFFVNGSLTFGGSAPTITGVENGFGGAVVQLSDNTQITFSGFSAAQLATMGASVGGSSIV